MARPKKYESRVEDALNYILPETIETLGAILEAPQKIGKAVLAQLPFGSRVVLEDLEVITHDENGYDLTGFGLDVAIAASQWQRPDPIEG